MTVINSNSITGINSITAQASALNFYDANGGQISIGASISGNVTGDVTGNVTGNVTGDLTGNASGTAGGLSGTPNVTVGVMTATTISGVSTIGVTTVTATTLTVNGNAYPSTGALSNRNLIINGAMQAAQRGITSTSSDFHTVDRFYYNFGNTLAGVQSHFSLSSGTTYDEGFRNSYRFHVTTPGDAASTYCQLIQPIEAQNLATSGWQYTSADSDVTVSFWVKSSVSQTFYGALVTQDGTQQNYIFSFAPSADTWTKVTKTIPGNSGITINNDNGNGADLIIYPFMGTNYSDSGATVDAWQTYSGGSRVPDMATTWMSTNGATFEVTGVQLEVGEVATPFEHRSYGDELRRCQRYCEVLEKNENETLVGIGLAYSTTRLLTAHTFKVTKRTSPSMTIKGAAADVELLEHGGGWTASSSVIATTGRSMCRIDCTCGSAIFTGGEAGEVRINSNTTKLIFACEI